MPRTTGRVEKLAGGTFGEVYFARGAASFEDTLGLATSSNTSMPSYFCGCSQWESWCSTRLWAAAG